MSNLHRQSLLPCQVQFLKHDNRSHMTTSYFHWELYIICCSFNIAWYFSLKKNIPSQLYFTLYAARNSVVENKYCNCTHQNPCTYLHVISNTSQRPSRKVLCKYDSSWYRHYRCIRVKISMLGSRFFGLRYPFLNSLGLCCIFEVMFATRHYASTVYATISCLFMTSWNCAR